MTLEMYRVENMLDFLIFVMFSIVRQIKQPYQYTI